MAKKQELKKTAAELAQEAFDEHPHVHSVWVDVESQEWHIVQHVTGKGQESKDNFEKVTRPSASESKE
jgi:urate oxidase